MLYPSGTFNFAPLRVFYNRKPKDFSFAWKNFHTPNSQWANLKKERSTPLSPKETARNPPEPKRRNSDAAECRRCGGKVHPGGEVCTGFFCPQGALFLATASAWAFWDVLRSCFAASDQRSREGRSTYFSGISLQLQNVGPDEPPFCHGLSEGEQTPNNMFMDDIYIYIHIYICIYIYVYIVQQNWPLGTMAPFLLVCAT